MATFNNNNNNSQKQQRLAVSLNNVGAALIERGCGEAAWHTLRDAVFVMRVAMGTVVPPPTQSLEPLKQQADQRYCLSQQLSTTTEAPSQEPLPWLWHLDPIRIEDVLESHTSSLGFTQDKDIQTAIILYNFGIASMHMGYSLLTATTTTTPRRATTTTTATETATSIASSTSEASTALSVQPSQQQQQQQQRSELFHHAFCFFQLAHEIMSRMDGRVDRNDLLHHYQVLGIHRAILKGMHAVTWVEESLRDVHTAVQRELVHFSNCVHQLGDFIQETFSMHQHCAVAPEA